jgi:hypothetical protein
MSGVDPHVFEIIKIISQHNAFKHEKEAKYEPSTLPKSIDGPGG